jgi:hypothetical protein
MSEETETPEGRQLRTLIPRDGDVGRPMYARLHAHRRRASRGARADEGVRIALAWATSWKPDVDGRLVLGKCKKASDLDRELAPFDFVILLNRDFWLNPRVTDRQRDALLDHELMHAAIAYDEHGDPKIDARGRTVYRIRKHDIEEFRDVVARHGCYKADLEDFARAIARAESQTAGAWVSYSTLHEQLRRIGVHVDKLEIATWSDDERREVHTWALLREDPESRTVGRDCDRVDAVVPAAALQVRRRRTEDGNECDNDRQTTSKPRAPAMRASALPGARDQGQPRGGLSVHARAPHGRRGASLIPPIHRNRSDRKE